MPEPQSEIFRKVALDRLSSPEQLDRLMNVTSPKAWVALLASGAVLLTALLWGIYGSIPTLVEGHGILMRGGAIHDVVSAGSGVVTEVFATANENLPAHHLVARISQPELELRIRNAELELDDLHTQNQRLTAAEDETLRIDLLSLRQERTNLLAAIAAFNQQIAALARKIARQQEAVAAGLIIESSLLATQVELATAEQQQAQAHLRLTQIAAAEVDRPMQVEHQRSARRQRREDAARNLDLLRRQLELNSVIRSPYAGRVIELTVDPGNMVTAGTRVISLEQLEAELRAVLFIPAAEGKRVARGMDVRLSPSTVKKEEAGYILGKVTFVSRFPATTEGMMRSLRNLDLARQLSAQGPPIEVHVALAPGERGGYRWSSARASPPLITSGTLCAGSIVVETSSPLSRVIPLVRGAFTR